MDKKEECKDNKCRINVTEDQYKQLEKDILRILIPSPEQRKPSSWNYAVSRRTVEGIMEVVKCFVIERLVEFVGHK